MSTRSRIGILLPDDSILSVYHHWDGYPEWLGRILKQHYNTKEKVAELIDGGNMSSCYSDNVYDYDKRKYPMMVSRKVAKEKVKSSFIIKQRD